LNDASVGSIDGGLEDSVDLAPPHKLCALKGEFSQGQDVMGKGFELTEDEKNDLIAQDRRSERVIRELYNGSDLVNLPTLTPYRWVIYFRQMSEDEARKFPLAFERLEHLVKPYRDGLTGQIHETCFWKFWDFRPRLVQEMESHSHILASPVVSKYVCFRRVPTPHIYNHKTKLYYFYEWWQFAVLQSSLHAEWAIHWCAKMGGSGISYSTSAALETWPMPSSGTVLESAGALYHDHRESILVKRSEGLTQTYNRFHDPDETSADIQKLRDLHVEMDQAVAAAYGWSDLNLGHGFHETKQGVRFTISETARREVLQRLLKLNHERYAEEVKHGLHGKKGAAKNAAPKKATSKPAKQEASLFDGEDDE